MEARVVRVRWKSEVRDVEPAASGSETRAFLSGDRAWVWSRGRSWEFTREKDGPSRSARRHEAAGGLQSPMPGRIRKVHVASGDRVSKGQILLVLEAMKMEHVIRSPYDGQVERVAFAEGDLVESGAVLADVSPASSE
jgi:biotin carboxyl carrier protein